MQQIVFIKEIDKLKYILRKSKLFNSNRHENDAEHSWHLALMAMVLVEHADEPVNMSKVIKMLLIHDLVEIDAGDVFLFDTPTRLDNVSAETAAAERIFGLLPEDQGQEIMELWREFEIAQSLEARFAHALDRLEPVLQNTSNKGGSWKEFNISQDQVIEKNSCIHQGSQSLWTFAESLIKECFQNEDPKKAANLEK